MWCTIFVSAAFVFGSVFAAQAQRNSDVPLGPSIINPQSKPTKPQPNSDAKGSTETKGSGDNKGAAPAGATGGTKANGSPKN